LGVIHGATHGAAVRASAHPAPTTHASRTGSGGVSGRAGHRGIVSLRRRCRGICLVDSTAFCANRLVLGSQLPVEPLQLLDLVVGQVELAPMGQHGGDGRMDQGRLRGRSCRCGRRSVFRRRMRTGAHQQGPAEKGCLASSQTMSSMGVTTSWQRAFHHLRVPHRQKLRTNK